MLQFQSAMAGELFLSTWLCYHLSHLRRLASGAIFIDTECSFDARRAAAMAGALATHIAALDAQSATDNSAATTAAPTCDSILARIQVVRVHSFLELVKLVHALPHILRTNTPPVRLVVIDSVAAVARGDPTLQADAGERVRMLSALGARLRDVAVAGDAAVVVTNHVTVAAQTVALDGDESAAAGGNALVQCPALGDRWRHWCDTRVFLEFNGTTRTARLIKGGKDQTVTFSITDEGIRD